MPRFCTQVNILPQSYTPSPLLLLQDPLFLRLHQSCMVFLSQEERMALTHYELLFDWRSGLTSTLPDDRITAPGDPLSHRGLS